MVRVGEEVSGSTGEQCLGMKSWNEGEPCSAVEAVETVETWAEGVRQGVSHKAAGM